MFNINYRHLRFDFVFFELCLNTIEREYNDIDYRSLMDIRISSCVKYRVGKNSNGELHTAVALDEMQENVNGWTKKIIMDNDENSWFNHSHNVLLACKCMSFVDGEYKTNYLYIDRQNQDMEAERGRKGYSSNTIIPRQTVEKIRLYEFMTKFFSTELPNRAYSNNDANSIIEDLATELKPGT